MNKPKHVAAIVIAAIKLWIGGLYFLSLCCLRAQRGLNTLKLWTLVARTSISFTWWWLLYVAETCSCYHCRYNRVVHWRDMLFSLWKKYIFQVLCDEIKEVVFLCFCCWKCVWVWNTVSDTKGRTYVEEAWNEATA